MKRIVTSLLFVVILLQTAGLSACDTDRQTSTPEPAREIQVYEGYYDARENLSSFVACEAQEEPGEGKGYWLVTNAEFDEMYQAEVGKLIQAFIGTGTPDSQAGIYIKFKGRVSPALAPASGEGYGYLNQYRQEITVTEPIQMKYFILPYDVDLCQPK
jgi:hypothetical protein